MIFRFLAETYSYTPDQIMHLTLPQLDYLTSSPDSLGGQTVRQCGSIQEALSLRAKRLAERDSWIAEQLRRLNHA